MDLNELVYIDETGYHFADYPTFLAWRQQQYRDIYGDDIYIEPDSQDGQLIAIQAKSDYDTAALGAAVYNSFNPLDARGVGLSRLVKINGLSRGIPTKSTVDILIVGVVGTVIQDGVVQDDQNNKWDLPATVTIPSGGEITVTATCQTEGAIQAPANTVTQIYTPTLGWQTVNNPTDGTPGAAVEQDAQLKQRQAMSTANPSLTVMEGTVGAVANLPGVTKIRGYENDTGVTDGIGLPAHSIALVVAGGVTSEVAQTIAKHKTPGTRTVGTTSHVVYDSHGMPLTIRFYRPDVITIDVEVVITARQGWTNDYIPLIKQAVAAQINAGRIGDTILLTKLYVPAYLTGTPAGQTYDLVSVEIAKSGDPLGTNNIDLDFDEQPFCDPLTDVAVIVS